jgi:hypothetical protein
MAQQPLFSPVAQPPSATVIILPTNLYVATTGNDVTGNGTIGNPFATPQRALDYIPPEQKMLYKYIINLAAGVYSTSSRSAASMDRPSIIYVDKGKMGMRTDAPGGVMTGSVVFVSTTPLAAILAPGSALGYVRAVYNTGFSGSVGFQDIKVLAGVGTDSCVVAHRGAYNHIIGMEIDGASNATFGVMSEAGGFTEAITINVHDCAINVQSYQASTVQISLNSTIGAATSLGINIPSGGYVGLTTGTVCNSNVIMQAGGKFDNTGISSSRVTINGTLNLRGGAWTTAFTDITGTMTTYPGLEINTGATGYSNTWLDYGSSGYVPGMVSYVSPATQSTVAIPLTHVNGICNLFKDATFRIVNNAAVETAEGMNGGAVAVPASAAPLTNVLRNNMFVTTTVTATANRTAITLPNTGMPGRFASAPVPAGYQWTIIGGSTFTVQFVAGATADLMGLASITIGTASGSYGGILAVMGATGIWRVFPLGLVRP